MQMYGKCGWNGNFDSDSGRGTPKDIEAVVIWLGANPCCLILMGAKSGMLITRHVKLGNES